MTAPKDIIEEIQEFLDWNRYMTVTFAIWGFIFAVASQLKNTLQEDCTAASIIFWLGIGLAIIGTAGEFFTDVLSLYEFDDSKNSVIPCFSWGPCENIDNKKDLMGRFVVALILRISSNATLFTTIVLASSFAWFPTSDCNIRDGIKHTLPWLALATGILLLPRLFLVRYPQRKKKQKPMYIKFLNHDDEEIDIGTLIREAVGKQMIIKDEAQNSS